MLSSLVDSVSLQPSLVLEVLLRVNFADISDKVAKQLLAYLWPNQSKRGITMGANQFNPD